MKRENKTVNNKTTNVFFINCVEYCRNDVSQLKKKFESLKYSCNEININNVSDLRTAVNNQKENLFEISVVFLFTYGFNYDYFFFGSEFCDRSTLYNHFKNLKRNKEDPLILFSNLFYKSATADHIYVEEEELYVTNMHTIQMNTFSPAQEGSFLARYMTEESGSKSTIMDLSNKLCRKFHDREGVGKHSVYFRSDGALYDIFFPR